MSYQQDIPLMPMEIHTRCHEILCELDLIQPHEPISVSSLAGGVASDIAHISAGHTQYCVKFALPKLKVKADWFAPTHRNLAEYAWLEYTAQLHPKMAVRLFGQSTQKLGFVMEFLQGEDIYLWKDALLQGTSKGDEAGLVGHVIGKIHAAASTADFDPSDFKNRDDFRALRIEPYLLYTATQHPDLATILHQLADTLYRADTTLIHGDVSPKNIFFRPAGPVILDAECATMGDPAFDIAFCVNHLILKAFHLSQHQKAYLEYVQQFWDSYAPHINWENPPLLEARVCHLLPALMLARVDGKSPVEYLNRREAQLIRECARYLLHNPEISIGGLLSKLNKPKPE